MANFLPALPLCDRWEMIAEVLVDETSGETRQFALDYTEDLGSHYSAGVSPPSIEEAYVIPQFGD
jgi:predicted nuclease of restriction endonuclease-like RecB superfamily